jgi:hypothetical protein
MNTTLTASGKANDWIFDNVTVINPGCNFGNTFLIHADVGNVSTPYIVEAYHEQDAIEAFADSRLGHLILLDEEMVDEAELDGTIEEYLHTESGYVDLSYFSINKTEWCKYSMTADEFWKLEL